MNSTPLHTNASENLLSQLYDRYSPAIYGIVVKNFADTTVAADILQQSFINFSHQISNRSCITEGYFICLYRIAQKIVTERKMESEKMESLQTQTHSPLRAASISDAASR